MQNILKTYVKMKWNVKRMEEYAMKQISNF